MRFADMHTACTAKSELHGGFHTDVRHKFAKATSSCEHVRTLKKKGLQLLAAYAWFSTCDRNQLSVGAVALQIAGRCHVINCKTVMVFYS